AMAADGGGTVKPLQNAMKLANVAIQLDANNQSKEAYCEYLRSIHYITQALLEETGAKDGNEVVTPDTQRMLKLAEQCLERVKSTATKLEKTKMKPVLPQAPKLTAAPCHRRVLSDGGGQVSSFLPPEIFQRMQEAEAQRAKKELTPLEEASVQNQKLKAAYEARLARLNPGQAVQKTSLTLSLQRQMTENLIIAKARQETLHRKMEERRLRLQEEANRRFSSSTALTLEEQEQRVLYTSILEYEQDNEWPKQWKDKLKKNPNDLALVAGLISYMLGCPDHPITQLLKRLQYRIYNKLYPIVSKNDPGGHTESSDLSFHSLGADVMMPSTNEKHQLRSSQSVHCLASVQENKMINSQGLKHSASVNSVPVMRDHNVNVSPTEHSGLALNPPGPQTLKKGPMEQRAIDRDNSFEDLELFLAQMEHQPLCGVNPEGQRLKGQLKDIVKDLHNSIDKLLSLCILAFEALNTASGKDQCLASIEETFFPPIWPPLLALYR
uniref:VPS9 domain containing 1 n=1 Tax=Latimeria chalumnae TaxID=7897 RepID=H3AYQ1_LATCH